MNTKWPIVAMMVIGIGAALCAAVLVSALQAGTQEFSPSQSSSQITVVVAATDMPVATIIDAESVTTQIIHRPQVPDGALTDPVQVLGKVLGVPVVAGQVLTGSSLAADHSGIHLVSTLPRGMRAVALSLEDSSGLHGMLYPGCIVDVLVTYRQRHSEEQTSETLLQGIRVLAIEDKTIFSPDGSEGRSAPRMGRHMVTLLVTPEQAEMLHPAMERGQVSLALRNPLDTQLRNNEQVLAEGPPADLPAPLAAVMAPPKKEKFVIVEVRGHEKVSVTYIKVNGRWVDQEHYSGRN